MTPASALRVSPPTPFGAGTDAVRLLADGAPVPATNALVGAALVITPLRALRPAAALSLDLASLRDVLGRPYTLAGEPRLHRTTATVADWTFAAAPPDGAVAGSLPARVTNGALAPGRDFAGPYRMVVALGAPPADAAALELRYAFTYPCGPYYAVALVSESGESARFTLADGAGPQTARADVPAGGALWLTIESTQPAPVPGSLPPPICTLSVDELRAAL